MQIDAMIGPGGPLTLPHAALATLPIYLSVMHGQCMAHGGQSVMAVTDVLAILYLCGKLGTLGNL